MSAPRRNGEEGSGPRRLYKLVGALVVALVIAAALVPLWLGGGEDQQTRLVEVKPESLNGPSEGNGASKGPQDPDDSEPEPPSDEDGGKWWQPDGSETGSEETDSEETEAGEGASPASSPEEAPEASAQASEEGEPTPAQETEDEAAGSDGEVPVPEEEPAQATEEEPSTPRDATPEVTDADQKAEPERPYWTVMVGSFREPANARGLKERLGEQGYAVEVVTKTIEGQKWRRVYAGRKGSREEAEQVMARLKEAGYNDLLVLQAE